MSAPPEAEKAYRKPSYEPLRGFKLLDPVDQPNNAPTSGVACAEDPDGNTSSRAELTFQPCIRLCVTKDSFHRIGANLAKRKDECDADVQIKPDHWAEPRGPCG